MFDLSGFDDVVERAMAEWHVPGLALAAMKDGEIVLAKGYGWRDMDRQQPVTPDTLFAIGSSSKAFTTMALALLVDEGKLDWDKPVRDYIPEFRLYDAVAAERLTPRDLVTHRSGLPRHDLMWYRRHMTRREIVDALRYLEPTKDIRTTFQYQNMMYVTAGYLLEQIAGQTWESFVSERIFAPLGMGRANFRAVDSLADDDHALPYAWRETTNTLERIPFYDDWLNTEEFDSLGPAGTINASVNEMMRWLQMHLQKGVYFNTDGAEARLASEAAMTEMHAVQMAISLSSRFNLFNNEVPEIGQSGYGLGWFIESYRGTPWIHHGGNIDGFSALASFLPEHNMAVMVLTNLSSNGATSSVTNDLFDRLLGAEPKPWSTLRYDFTERLKTKGKESLAELLGEKQDAPLLHAPASYAGEYTHPAYGVFEIVVEGDTMQALYHGMTMALTHHHYDVFTMLCEDLSPVPIPLMFETSYAGQITALAVPFEDGIDPIAFKRVVASDEGQGA